VAGTLSDISANGNLVLFNSGAQAVDGDGNGLPDLYLRDVAAQTTTLVTVATDGTQADFVTDVVAALSSGGRLVAFSSIAATFDADDRNVLRDIYVRDLMAGTTTRASLGMDAINPNAECTDPAFSRDATTLAFATEASNMIPDDDNDARDVFVVVTGISDPPMIVSRGVPPARTGAPYSAALTVAGGRRPLYWAAHDGLLPPGLFLDSQSGEITGLPQRAGTYTFTLLVMDSDRPTRRALRTVTLVVE
jgi:Tol biopolymer transport system component